jgi:chemosensory pili system protein ChpA (sensor histidine kinase/response regulator)
MPPATPTACRLQTPTDYSLSVLGRFDPAIIVHAKKRVAAAKEAWSATAGGEMHRISGLAEQFALVGDSLRKLFPFGESFAAELQSAVVQTQQSNAAPPPHLAMEVATSLLYIEAALEDGDFDEPGHADRVRRLGERLAAVRQDAPPQPLETWMEELYRRVSDRQTMGSVVQELRASLGVAEKAIDEFFRNPTNSGVLVDVPVQLSSMRGVLSVLGMDQASHALLRMRDEVDGLVSTEVDPAKVAKAGVFDRIAGNLSALGFMIDMLSVQPQLAKSLFVFDAEKGTLAPLMGRAEPPGKAEPAPVEPHLIEAAQMLAFSSVREDVPLQEVTLELERLSHEAQAADQPTLAAAVLKAQEAILSAADDPAKVTTARGELSEALVDFVATATEPAGLEVISEPAPLAPMKPIALVGDLEHDDEMRDVFLEEAREVIEGALAACEQLQHAPGDLGLLTTGAPRLPHAQGQRPHGRPQVLRRSCLGLRAGLQHPARRAARGRAAADRVRDLGARPPLELGRGHRRASRRRAQRRRGQDGRRPGGPAPRDRRGQLRHRPADGHAVRPAERCRSPARPAAGRGASGRDARRGRLRA